SLAAAAAITCSNVPKPAEPTPSSAPREPNASQTLVRAAPAAVPAPPERPPPPLILTPMAGEPSASSLTQVRLQPLSCAAAGELAIERAEALVRQMRAELEASFRDWKANRTRHCRPRRKSGGRLGGSHSVRSSGPAGLGRSGLSVGGIGAGAGSGAGAEGSAAAPARFSGTHTQVASVDEADVVTPDGNYVCVVMNGALRILEAQRPRLVSTTPLDGDVKELFVEGDRAVVYVANGGSGRPRCTYGYDCQFSGD